MAEVSAERAPRPTKGAAKSSGKEGTLEVTIGTMIETPRAAVRADEIAEEGFTCPFRQLMFLGQGRSKMPERNGTLGFGRSGWFLCFTW